MRQFNEKDYNLVTKYEDDFRRAIDSRYAKGITRDAFDEISQVYKETLNRQANSNCGGCVLQMLTSVGRLYFAYKGKMEDELKKKELEKKNKSQKGSNRRSAKNKEEKKDVHKDKIEVKGGEGNPVDVSDNK